MTQIIFTETEQFTLIRLVSEEMDQEAQRLHEMDHRVDLDVYENQLALLQELIDVYRKLKPT